MQPNISIAQPPKLMHDVKPPYDAALLSTRIASQNPAPTDAGDQTIPVVKEGADSPMFPQHIAQAAAQPIQAEAREAVKAQQVLPKVSVHEKPRASGQKINWLVITLAVLVSSALFFAAYTAFKQSS